MKHTCNWSEAQSKEMHEALTLKVRRMKPLWSHADWWVAADLVKEGLHHTHSAKSAAARH